MDPLEVLKQALSAPAGSEEQRTVLTTLRERLELQPGLIHPLCMTLIPTVAGSADSLMKAWVLDLLHYALSRSPLPVDAKAQLAAQCLDVLANLVNDPSPRTVKVAVQCFASVYPLLFRTLCINRNPISQWETLTRVKARIIDVLKNPASTASLGIKEAALKFVQRVIQVQTRGISDPRLQNTADPNLTSVPSNHPFISSPVLEAEANQLIEMIVTIFFTSQNPDLLGSLVNSWAPVIKHRPALTPIVVTALAAWAPNALASAAPRDVKSVEKAVRILLIHLMRTPHGQPFHEQITAALQALDARMKAAAAAEEQARSRKRAASEDQMPEAKRPKLEQPAPAPEPALALPPDFSLQEFDFSVLPQQLVVEFIIADLQIIPEATLQAAVNRYRASQATPAPAPAPTPIAAAVPAPSTAPAADAAPPPPPPVVVKTEPLDPLKMEMDEEIEFDSEQVNQQVAPPPAEEPEAVLHLAEFVPPPPVRLSVAQRKKALSTIEKRAYAGTAEVDEVESQGRMARGAELQAILLVRSITRSGFDLSSEAKKEKEEPADGEGAGEDMEVEVQPDVVREKLCYYVLQDLPARVRLATTWMNEEWYNDKIRREHSPDAPQNYGNWLRRILNGYRSHLDSKDRTFARFLLDLPGISDDILDFVRELTLDADKMQVGFTTLRELVSLRLPVRKAAMAMLLDLTTHPERITRNASIITVKRWVPDIHPMSRLVQRFALQMLRRLQTIPAPPKPPPSTEEEDEDGQLPQEQLGDEEVHVPAYLPATLEMPVDRAVVLQHVELVFALCVKVPDFLEDVFAAYGRMEPSVQEALQELMTPLIKSLGPNHGKLLTLLRTFPAGSESLALRVLNIFTEHAKPTAPLVAVVKGLVAERDLDARFLIPIMSEMDKADVVKHLPRIVSILNGKPEEQGIVRNVFTTVVAAPPSTSGTSNQPRIRHSDMLTPSELMVLLHKQEMEIGVKPTMEAISICFSMSDIFGQEVLAVVMQQILDEPTVPVLFMRTVILAVQTYSSLVRFVSTTLLSRLITKKIWQTPVLWDGFIRCAKLIAPSSFNALLQLPKEQLRDLADKQPALKSGLRDYVIRKAGNRARVAQFLEVFGDDTTPEAANAGGESPAPQPQTTVVGS
ncbi:hypothetical protein AURDEDRAFT_65903 [Auricularia subglabra TFB-10046 SS5]|nr:hypothetical protein AURDEDRAFT_65903 [Auricularia subglabra TFB-10046 SS5]